MKKTVTILLLLLSCLPAAAQQMLIEKHDNNHEIVNLVNLKEITFTDNMVNVEQKDGTRSCNAMSAISSISFGDYTAVEQIRPASGELASYVSMDEIAINCESGVQVTIYNVMGTQILSTRLNTAYGKVSIADLPKGIYIVKANERTAKIVKR